MSMLFAASYPGRTRALVLCGAEVKEERTDDWPWGELTARWSSKNGWTWKALSRRWGKGLSADLFAPSRAGDPQLREQVGRLQVQSATPTTPSPSCAWPSRSTSGTSFPAVKRQRSIVHRVGDQGLLRRERALVLRGYVEGARYVELPGENHVPFIDGDDIADEIQEFLTGVREPAAPDRVLATVLFTDIVGSTRTGARTRRPPLARSARAPPRGRASRPRARFADWRSTRPATGSSPPSMAPRARSVRALDRRERARRRARRALGPAHRRVRAERWIGSGIAVHTGARVASLAAQARCSCPAP